MNITSSFTDLYWNNYSKGIRFEWERGKAMAESDRGQPCVSELNKIAEISVYTKGTRPDFYWRTSVWTQGNRMSGSFDRLLVASNNTGCCILFIIMLTDIRFPITLEYKILFCIFVIITEISSQWFISKSLIGNQCKLHCVTF
jgi:hypothetical protein